MTIDFLLMLILVISLITDLKYRRIYNAVTLPALLVGLTINSYNFGISGLLFFGKGLLLGAALLFIPFILGGVGAGDVKLLAVVGAFKGPQFVLSAFLLTAILGGIISLVILLYNRRLISTLRRLGQGIKVLLYSRFTLWNFGHLDDKPENSCSFPYGLAIVLGSLSAYWVM